MIKLSDYVMKFVASQGVKHIFMLPGGGCMHLVDSLGRNRKLRFIPMLHEQAAAIAADASAQYTGKPGVVLVTTGPGGTNTVTGVAASWIDSTPVIYLSGQAKRADLLKGRGVRQMGVQEVDVVSIVSSITKYAVTVMRPEDIRFHLEKAVQLAHEGRKGPVWIEIPLDVQGSLIDEKKLKGFTPSKKILKKPDISQCVKLLKAAKRPVILAGNGIRMAGAASGFLKLIRKLNIPVLTTWRAADMLPENDPLYFGRPGSVGQRAANFIQQNSDLIITIGARLDLPQVAFDYANFARDAKKIIVDIDAAEIRKMGFKKDIAINSDAKVFIELLLKRAKPSGTNKWREWCARLKRSYPVPDKSSLLTSGEFINTYNLIDVLSKQLTARDILVPGSSGSCAEVTMQTIKIKKGLRVLNTPGLGSMGFGLPAGIGACVASGRRTIGVVGDGGLQHNIQELETIKRLGLPYKLFILNNNGYGSIRMMQTRHFKGRLVSCDPSSGLTVPDTLRIAEAYGIKTKRITAKDNLEKKVKEVLSSKGPVICDVEVEPMLETAPRVSSAVLPDGRIVSKPLEDLWPFLERDEFQAGMLIKPAEEA